MRDLAEVIEHVQNYFVKHLPQYTVLEVRKKSVFPEDDYLYMVSARKVDGSSYAVWTSWNETIYALNYGHYDLQNVEQCEQIFREFYNDGKWN